ncbi:3-hydroxyacyl-CoA dehydrogenase [Castellaniella hirudinis]|uniref:3-hydroxyacyl-CoA dehydrogenase n=1 Tax=Castellaniella hirudinis TaxID=1144617 RepID=UPI0039C0D6EE
MATLDSQRAVAVIGAGTMGAGIAQVAAMAGHPVILYDTREGAAAQAIAGIGKTLQTLASRQKVDSAQAARAVAALKPAQTLADLADCGLVVEAIVERLDAKAQLFAALEDIVSPACLLATNTSSIPVTAIGAALKHPGRLGGMHFFNPAPRLPLVEIISGLDTRPDTAQCLFDTAFAWGKSPVRARSTPGFIVNRVARPFYGEGLRLLQEQAVDAATLDYIARACGGFRMGPCELTDLIGQDVNAAVSRSVWAAFHHAPRFEPSLVQQELVDGGRLGRKAGRGFFDYADGAPAPAPSLAASQPRPDVIALFGGSPLAQALGSRLRAAGVPFQACAERGDGRVAQADEALLYLTDGRSATQRAHDLGQPATLLLDLSLDPATARCMPLAAARQCPPAAVAAATGLLQAAGLDVAPIRDVPGMVVMRTVAMLANEALDTVSQGVCSAADVDQAMRLGVNYPLGPLAWCARIGADTVGTVLTHLHAAYGERYLPCAALKSSIYSGIPLHVA